MAILLTAVGNPTCDNRRYQIALYCLPSFLTAVRLPYHDVWIINSIFTRILVVYLNFILFRILRTGLLWAVGFERWRTRSTIIFSLSPMQKSSKYEWGFFLFWAVVIFSPTAEMAIAADAGSPPDGRAAEEIPTGFKIDRYAGLWQRNPFTLVAPSMPEPKRSVFDKLFLTSWLKDGRSDVVFIQDSETNEVQRITAEPNKDNLRLIALRLSPSPQLVEAMISDGKEVRPVKFRLEAQFPSGQAVPAVAQITGRSAAAMVSNSGQAASAPGNAQTSGVPPVAEPLALRGRSGIPRAQGKGVQRPGPHGESEGLHLPSPGRTSG
jgi:hypothetical protein